MQLEHHTVPVLVAQHAVPERDLNMSAAQRVLIRSCTC